MLPINANNTKSAGYVNITNNKFKPDNIYVANFKGDSFESEDITKREFYNLVHGYRSDKEEFYDSYLKPLFSINDSIDAKASILLCGPDKSVLYRFCSGVNGIAKYQGLNFVDMSKDIEDDSFIQKLKSQLEENKEYYNHNEKRSIIFIDSPEKFLGMNTADAKSRTNIDFDEVDMSILSASKNAETIAQFKTLLDNCHHLPNDKIPGYATTFIFNSTNPHLIHPDLRDGKMSKMYIDLPKGKNLTQMLIDQLENAKNIVMMHLKQQFAIQNINSEALQNCTEKIKNMEIHEDNIASCLLNVFTSPNQFIGGYSGISLNDTIFKACVKTMELPYPIPFVTVLANILSNTPRDISPQQIIKHNKIKDSISKQFDEYERLMALKEDAMLSENEQNILTQLISYEKNMAEYLMLKQTSGLITPDEEVLLNKFVKRYDLIL